MVSIVEEDDDDKINIMNWDWDWDWEEEDPLPRISEEEGDDVFDLNSFDFDIDDPIPNPNPNPNDDVVPLLSMGEIEHLLMTDDHHHQPLSSDLPQNHHLLNFSDDLFSDFLVDVSPAESHLSSASSSSSSAKPPLGDDVVVVEENDDGKNLKIGDDLVLQNHDDDDDDHDHSGDGHANDPVSKKRKRQLRNRDAAVRSRERKKMYVRDLEIKSKYLEGECKRLGILLQCCFAENHALRLSLHNNRNKAFDASVTKQESAVLLLESLLLGSLLWFLGIICLLILPKLLLHPTVESVGGKNQGTCLASRKVGSKESGLRLFPSFIMSKRCKASRFRMKPSFLRLEVLV